MKYQSVLIRVQGRSDVRCFVPASATSGDPVAEAVEMLKSLIDTPVSQWIAEVSTTYNVTDVEPKP